MSSFDESLAIIAVPDASFLAGGLFFESFGVPFPVPRSNCGLPIPTPPHAWHQYVALYRWSERSVETVGFCNWIRYGDVYLEGGMCVRSDFYRRLSKEHWASCKARGGIAEIMMRAAEQDLDDCIAWFGYCGDKKASIVDARVGYELTDRQHLIVKWFQLVNADRRRALVDLIAAIGPF